jgi:Hypothetical protein (DUF2513)
MWAKPVYRRFAHMQLVGPVKRRRTDVERNMDLIRDMLLKIAADPKLDGSSRYVFNPADNLGNYSQEELNYHVDLLLAAGYVDGNPDSNPNPMISKLTWKGHEFVDTVRDSGIWNSVKERLKGLPTVALSVVFDLAVAEAKKRLKLSH